MITATATTEALFRRIRTRAGQLIVRRGEALARSREDARTDWHSARSLWPDFGRD